MLKLFIFIKVFFVFSACSLRHGDYSLKPENKVKVISDSLTISQDELKEFENFDFSCYSSNYKINSDSSVSLIYLVNGTNVFDFNLTNRNFEKIKIVGDNPVKSSFLSLVKINEQYFIINDNSDLYVYSKDTLEHRLLNFEQLESFKNKKIWLTSDLGFACRNPFAGDSSIVLVVSNGQSFKKNGYTFAKVNLLRNETDFYQFERRKEYFKYYDPLRKGIKMETKGDTLIVHYLFSEKIDLYSLKNARYIGSKVLKSKYQVKPIPHLKTNKNEFESERYSIESDYYDILTYNPYKKCYYRLYYHALPRMNQKGEYTIWTDKTVSIVIFDQNFNWIGEEIVNWSHFYAGIVPHPEGALSMWGWRNEGTYNLSLIKHE